MNSRIWLGVFLIVIGIGFLLEQLSGWPFSDFFHVWWPAILVVAGVAQIVNRPNKLMGGLFMIGLGGLLIANHLTGTDFWSTALPLGLILFGIGFLLRDRDGGLNVQVKRTFVIGQNSREGTDIDDEVINVSAVFSSTNHRVQTNKFRGGKVSSLFGGVELDLRMAQMASTEASLDIDCTFGGVEIKVPQSWQVVVIGSPIFGGVENDTLVTGQHVESPHVLTCRVSVAFGGLEIKN